jgi:hypothetical protein
MAFRPRETYMTWSTMVCQLTPDAGLINVHVLQHEQDSFYTWVNFECKLPHAMGQFSVQINIRA